MFIWQEYPSLFRGIQLNASYADRHALAVRHRLIEVAAEQCTELSPDDEAGRRLTGAPFRLAARARDRVYLKRRSTAPVLSPSGSRQWSRQ